MKVYGATVDDETRCVHYGGSLDIIAIRFVCCGLYYPCHLCHADDADHPAALRPRERWGEPSVLCGVCRAEMTVDRYRDASACPTCGAGFNPGCRAHEHLYFEA